MPNHVTNLVTFGTDEASLSEFQQMLYNMRVDGEPLGSFDFNKLIPMPEPLNIEEGTRTERGLKLYQKFVQERAVINESGMPPEQKEKALAELDQAWQAIKMHDLETWKLGENAYYNLQKYGHSTWYGWCNQNWGTKWNTYQSRPLQDSDDTMVFLTAWSAVPNLMKKLSEKYPDQAITYRWADENIGYNVGEIVFQDGEIIESRTPEPGSPAAYEMSADIIGIDLAEFGLYLRKDKSGYEYHSEGTQTKGKQRGPER